MKNQNACTSCSKEPQGYVPVARVIERLDELAAKNDGAGMERVLDYWEKEAKALGDDRGLLVILSEEIGHYRREGDEKKGLSACEQALALLAVEEEITVADATVYLNIATTMKAFGKASEALKYYDIAREAYERELPPDDYRLAGYHNNYATALADMGKFGEAREHYLKALEILKAQDNVNEVAITYVNLAKLADDERAARGEEDDGSADEYIELAYATLTGANAVKNGPYANVCMKVADACGYHGYFLYKRELEDVARSIYRANGGDA